MNKRTLLETALRDSIDNASELMVRYLIRHLLVKRLSPKQLKQALYDLESIDSLAVSTAFKGLEADFDSVVEPHKIKEEDDKILELNISSEERTKLWNKFLDVKGYCHADPDTGNRPCDNGWYCDKCTARDVDLKFVKWARRVTRTK